jgi:hypothetical protein
MFLAFRGRIRVGESERREHPSFAALHAPRVDRTLVVVTEQMQATVDHQVCPMRERRLALPGRLACHHRRAQHDIAERSGASSCRARNGWNTDGHRDERTLVA